MDILDRIQVVQSRQDFRMCVPPQQDDTDVVLEDCRKEIESLRQQLAAAQEELHFQACLTRDLMPYQERALKSERQLAAALAACEVKDAALLAIQNRCAGDALPNWEHGDRTYYSRGWILDRTNYALEIKPDASALKAHDAELLSKYNIKS